MTIIPQRILFKIFPGLLLVALNFGQSVSAQSNTAFRAFGTQLYKMITDTAEGPRLEYIRIKTWHRLIDNQDWAYHRQTAAHEKVEKKYKSDYLHYHQLRRHLQNSWEQRQSSGASVEFLSFYYRPSTDTSNHYRATLKGLYREDSVQTVVTWKVPFYYTGKGFILTAPIEEKF